MGKIKMKMSNFKYRILKGIGSWFIKKSVIHVMKERKRETCGIFHKFNDHLFMEAIVTTKEPFLSGMSMKFWKSTIYGDNTDNQDGSEESSDSNRGHAHDKVLPIPEEKHQESNKYRPCDRKAPCRGQTI